MRHTGNKRSAKNNPTTFKKINCKLKTVLPLKSVLVSNVHVGESSQMPISSHTEDTIPQHSHYIYKCHTKCFYIY